MMYIKIPSLVKNSYYENLGIDSDVRNSYIYLNLASVHIAPAMDEDGEIIEGACNLVDVNGQIKAHIKNKSPEQMLNYINGQCIMEIG